MNNKPPVSRVLTTLGFALTLCLFSILFQITDGSTFAYAADTFGNTVTDSPLGGGMNASAPSDSAETRSTIATMVPFEGTSVAYGDVVGFDDSVQAYVLSKTSGIEAFGVVIKDPALLFKSEGGGGRIPLMSTGPALVNVTLEGGPISIGDPLTSSSVPGKARRATEEESVFARAAESFSGEGGILIPGPNGEDIVSGTILVDIGSLVGHSTQVPEVSGKEPCITIACRLVAALDPDVALVLLRYLLSGTIAAASLIFAFKSFMADANNGVISIGRNPLARASIRSIVFFNAFLALAIAGAGLLTAIIILFVGS